MGPKFGNSSISMREFFNNLGLALGWAGTDLDILHQSSKKVKTKTKKGFGGNSYVLRL